MSKKHTQTNTFIDTHPYRSFLQYLIDQDIKVRAVPDTDILLLAFPHKEHMIIKHFTSLIPQNIGVIINRKSLALEILTQNNIPTITYHHIDAPDDPTLKNTATFPCHLAADISAAQSFIVQNTYQLRSAAWKLLQYQDSLILTEVLDDTPTKIFISAEGYYSYYQEKDGQKVWWDGNIQDSTLYSLASKALASFPPLPYCTVTIEHDSNNQAIVTDIDIDIATFLDQRAYSADGSETTVAELLYRQMNSDD